MTSITCIQCKEEKEFLFQGDICSDCLAKRFAEARLEVGRLTPAQKERIKQRWEEYVKNETTNK